MAQRETYGGLTEKVLAAVIWICVALAAAFTFARTLIRYHVANHRFAEDGCVYFALAALVSMAVMYQLIIPTMFEVDAIIKGVAPGPGFMERASFFLKLQFAIIVLFWTTLWAVKFAVLFFYRQLLKGLPDQMRWWQALVLFTGLTYLSAWVTQLLSCQPISHYFVLGACETRRDIMVSNFSLYWTTAVDITCDILIMALPLRLIWNLRINKKQKLALAVMFSLGCIIIVFAIIRVIQIRASTHHVDPVWLALWSMIEASVAVIVSCLPLFRVLFYSNRPNSAFNRRRSSSRYSRSSRTKLLIANLGSVLHLGPVHEKPSRVGTSKTGSTAVGEA